MLREPEEVRLARVFSTFQINAIGAPAAALN
jgi:hypothetical protein